MKTAKAKTVNPASEYLSVIGPNGGLHNPPTKNKVRLPKPTKWETRIKWSIIALKAIAGGIFGASASGIAYLTMHRELMNATELNLYTGVSAAILIGCLLFSAPTAYEFFHNSFKHKVKSIGIVKSVGLVVLFELCMLNSKIPWLAVSCAILLMAVNGFAAAQKQIEASLSKE